MLAKPITFNIIQKVDPVDQTKLLEAFMKKKYQIGNFFRIFFCNFPFLNKEMFEFLQNAQLTRTYYMTIISDPGIIDELMLQSL